MESIFSLCYTNALAEGVWRTTAPPSQVLLSPKARVAPENYIFTINTLHSIIEYGVNDETLEFFVEIAQNNLSLSLDEKKAEVSEKPEKSSIPEIPTPEATIDPEVMLAERTEEQQEKVEELSNTREDLIEMLGLLEEKNYFAEVHPELEGKLRYIFKDYKYFFLQH